MQNPAVQQQMAQMAAFMQNPQMIQKMQELQVRFAVLSILSVCHLPACPSDSLRSIVAFV
jgi:hypothetical protein